MASNPKPGEFLQGLGAGLLVAAGAAFLARAVDPGWVWQNLGYSVFPFMLLLVLYGLHFQALRRELATPEPSQVAVEHLSHYLDLWATVFFAVGVLWTAIGMRAALLDALGGDALSQGVSPAQMLSRLVDGGILLALSTTIVGSLGGYLMRLVKTWVVGRALLYREISQEQRLYSGIDGKLGRIEAILRAQVSETAVSPSKDNNN